MTTVCILMASGLGRRFGGDKLMAEFCGDDFRVIAAKDETDFASSTLGELLPHAFRFGKK